MIRERRHSVKYREVATQSTASRMQETNRARRWRQSQHFDDSPAAQVRIQETVIMEQLLAS
jgi:hypothetical protein